MRMNEKEFAKYVRTLRDMYPSINHDRHVKVYGENTKAGQDILQRASRYEGKYLFQVYDYFSENKRVAFDEVYDMFCSSETSDSFGICSHNSQQFSVSWVDGNEVIYITRNYEYHVICNE